MRVVEGPNDLAPPLKAHATCIASFPLVWAVVNTLGKDIFFFIQAFIETFSRISIIDLFTLKIGKMKDLERFLVEFSKITLVKRICIYLRCKLLLKIKKYISSSVSCKGALQFWSLHTSCNGSFCTYRLCIRGNADTVQSLFLFVMHFHSINSVIFNGKKEEECNGKKQGRIHGQYQWRMGGQGRKCAFSHFLTRWLWTDQRTDGQSLL